MTPQRVAIVTGGNRGLGYEIAKQLAERGLLVVVSSRDPAAGEQAAARLATAGLHVHSTTLDVTDAESVNAATEWVAERFGRVDVLVNNAGVAMDKGQRASRPDFSVVARTLDTNLMGAWRCSAAAAPHMVKNGYGRIVNITSHLGSMTTMRATNVSYRVSKAGLNALTKVLAAELKECGVLVNAASPGRMNTRMARDETTRTPQEGADTPVWLATLGDDGPAGGLYYERQPLDW